MTDERTQILIVVSDFFLVIAPVVVTRHQCHILKMALSSLFTDRAVMRMANHQAFDDTLAHIMSLFISDGNPSPVAGRRHAGHDDGTLLVVFIPVLFDGTLTARSDRTHTRMPTKVRKVKPQGQTLLQQIVIGIYFVLIPIDNNFCHLT